MISYLTPLQVDATSGGAIVTPLIIIATVLLIALMVIRELTQTLRGKWQALSRFFDIAIYPLIVSYGITLLVIVVDFVQHPPAAR